MRTFTFAVAKNHLGELIDKALAAPVSITKYDRPVVVVLTVEEYERLHPATKWSYEESAETLHGQDAPLLVCR